MNLKITKAFATLVGTQALEPFGVDPDRFDYGSKDATLALTKLGPKRLADLEQLLAKHADNKLVKPVLRDVQTWKTAITQPDKAKGRSVEQAAELLRQFLLKKCPGQRVFEAVKDQAGTWLCYYVGGVVYHPPSKGRGDDYTPPSISLKLFYEERGVRHSSNSHIRAEHCQGKTATEILRAVGLVVETSDLRAGYIKARDTFVDTWPKVGTQYWAAGRATTDGVDGNPDKRDQHGFTLYRDGGLNMTKADGPSKVVVDLFYEDRRDKDGDEPDPAYWQKVKDGTQALDDDDDGDEADDDLGISPVEVPVHPYVIVFDLARHLRVSIHIDQLTVYDYDTHLADKLVLADDRKELVKLLVETKAGAFQDIVKGKSGGAVVLLAGPPGTGKTLTAEVYAESEGRALYSVQCSQLGVNPEDLEDTLLTVFSRAQRWNAVLLVDEADVYVRQRADDLMQNAIVGVFLRVLEYQATVMFLTTNRSQDVDDAIASRCIAKLTYEPPTAEQQFRIWRVLLLAQRLAVEDDVIEAIVDENRDLTGRDIKNLIKLAKMRGPITPESIRFVKQFKPTGDYSRKAGA